MPPRFPLSPLCVRLQFLAVLALALCGAVDSAYCQKQEKVIAQRLDTRSFRERMDQGPDQSLTSSFAGKEFSPRSNANAQKSANNLRAFPFTRSAYSKDFRTKDFAGAKAFRSKDYAGVKTASVRTFAQTDKSFGTKTFAVRDDRMANKTFATREFVPGQREGILPKGKAQDTYDALMQQKEMSINQVRELLNKNGDHQYGAR